MRPPRFFRVWLAAAAFSALLPPFSRAASPSPALCKQDAALCADYAGLQGEIDGLMPVPVKKDGSFQFPEERLADAETLAKLNARYTALDEGVESLVFRLKPTDSSAAGKIALERDMLRHRLNVLSLGVIPMDLERLADVLWGLEGRANILEGEIAAAGAGLDQAAREGFLERLAVLDAAGARVWERTRAEALSIDRMSQVEYPISYADGRKKSAGAMTYTRDMNGIQGRVAALSKKLQVLAVRLERAPGKPPEEVEAETRMREERLAKSGLLVDPFTNKPLAAAGGGSGGGAGAASALKPRPTLLDMPRANIPTPAAAVGPKGSGVGEVLWGLFSDEPSTDSNPKETSRVARLRARGKTEIFGSPEARAAYVYRQNGNTCAIAAQVQVLQEYGKVARRDAQKAEDELYQRAVREGFFEGARADAARRQTGGTSGEYIGNLMDIPVKKHYQARVDALVAVLKKGKMVIASFDAGALWNLPEHANKGHVVVVTGVETSRETGNVLGFYINDTNTEEGARFITAKQFLGAWRKRTHLFVEPL